MLFHDFACTYTNKASGTTRRNKKKIQLRVETEYKQHSAFIYLLLQKASSLLALLSWQLVNKYKILQQTISFSLADSEQIQRGRRKVAIITSEEQHREEEETQNLHWQLAPLPRGSKQPPREKPDISA